MIEEEIVNHELPRAKMILMLLIVSQWVQLMLWTAQVADTRLLNWQRVAEKMYPKISSTGRIIKKLIQLVKCF